MQGKLSNEELTLPQGIEIVEIVAKKDKTTQNGDPMVSVAFAIAEGNFRGQWIWDNIILSENPASPGFKFLGRSKHFLHCIGQPYKSDDPWNSDNWMGRICKVKIEIEPANKFHSASKSIITKYILDEGVEKTEPGEDDSDQTDERGIPF